MRQTSLYDVRPTDTSLDRSRIGGGPDALSPTHGLASKDLTISMHLVSMDANSPACADRDGVDRPIMA
jgi:hypothetical protein